MQWGARLIVSVIVVCVPGSRLSAERPIGVGWAPVVGVRLAEPNHESSGQQFADEVDPGDLVVTQVDEYTIELFIAD